MSSLALKLVSETIETPAITHECTRFVVRIRLTPGEPELCMPWSSEEPLPLGHPVRWLLERSPSGGVRVRRLPLQLGIIEEAVVLELSTDGTPARAEGAEFSLKPARVLNAPFGTIEGSQLLAFSCRAASNSIVQSRELALDSRAIAQGSHTPLSLTLENFEVAADGAGFVITATSAGLQWRGRDLSVGERIMLDRAGLAGGCMLTSSGHEWRFGFGSSAILENRPGIQNAEEIAENRLFLRSFKFSAAATLALALLMLVAEHMGKTDKNAGEIPAQFAKIILTPAKSTPTSTASAQAPALANLPKKIQETAVVRAFRAQTLQKSLNGLLKGGMTRLLKQSEFAMGGRASAEAKRLFDTKSDALKPTAPTIAEMNGREVLVASLGGQGLSGIGVGSGKSVGYGKGEHAGVSGQGKSFVSADLAASSVEEGLTKDEVGEVIHRHLSEIRYCYESSMIKRPDIEGKLMIAFTVGGKGSVKESEIKSSTLPDPALDECVIRKLRTWAFPKPKGGVDVAVTYPFIFKTLGR